MIRMYPSYNNVLTQFKQVAGSQTGIIDSVVIPLVNYKDEPLLKSMTGTMPNYHTQVLKNGQNVTYHIIGYGSYFEESFIKYIGESIERYASLVGSTLTESDIVFSSYKELAKDNNVMPLEYLNVFSKNQIKKIHQQKLILCDKQASEDDVIAWIKCPSLLYLSKEIYVPMQMLFIGYENNIARGESRHIPAFSTGTASHKSMLKALENAIIEYIQLDAFMITWYTKKKCKRVIIDDKTVLSILKQHNLVGEESKFEIIPLYITQDDITLPNFAVILKRKDKKAPYMLIGLQADLDPVHALLRGIMEAIPIAQSAFYNTIFYPDAVEEVVSDNPRFNDLDKNVLFYAMPHMIKEKDVLIEELIDGEIKLSEIESVDQHSTENNVKYLINELKKVSNNAVFLDATPVEAREKGWYVMRVLVPEILEMCIPDYPFENHPRMIKHGGVRNVYPHPIP